jgi:hypothetical protein
LKLLAALCLALLLLAPAKAQQSAATVPAKFPNQTQNQANYWSDAIVQLDGETQQRSLFSICLVPKSTQYHPGHHIELGTTFISNANGQVVGARFYKAPAVQGHSGDTGPHYAHLWDKASGALLATAQFTNESDSGWQEVRFAHPQRIAAGHAYVISRDTPTGTFSINDFYFPNPLITGGHLTMPQSAGVIAYYN